MRRDVDDDVIEMASMMAGIDAVGTSALGRDRAAPRVDIQNACTEVPSVNSVGEGIFLIRWRAFRLDVDVGQLDFQLIAREVSVYPWASGPVVVMEPPVTSMRRS